MEKAILLVEDRPLRQQQTFKEFEKLNKFSFLTNISDSNIFNEFKQKIQDNYRKILEPYQVIMMHRSALPDWNNPITDFCMEKGKDLVFFSGGISYVHLVKIQKGHLLTINVKDFYSENLILFLENGGNNLYELAFGKNWEINLLADYVEKLSLFLSTTQENEFFWEEIKTLFKLNDEFLSKFVNLNQIPDWLEKKDLQDLLEKILKRLKKQVS